MQIQGVELSSAGGIDHSVENRTESDRRTFTWRTILYGFLLSRRRATRRAGDADPLFTDYHHPWLFFLAVGIMVMSCADAIFTLALLDRGAVEINPVMAVMIGKGPQAFAMSKMLLTGFGILALVFLARAMFMKRIRTGLFLTTFFNIYAVLVCYQFVSLLSSF